MSLMNCDGTNSVSTTMKSDNGVRARS